VLSGGVAAFVVQSRVEEGCDLVEQLQVHTGGATNQKHPARGGDAQRVGSSNRGSLEWSIAGGDNGEASLKVLACDACCADSARKEITAEQR
jgi:hypothetical protein